MESIFYTMLASSFAGCCSVLLCHPIDVARTQLQLSNSMNGRQNISMITNFMHTQGLFAFYRGIIPPLVAQTFYKSTIFTTNNFMISNVFNHQITNSTIFISATVAGSINALIASPVEFVRTQQIINNTKLFSTINLIINRHGSAELWRSLLPALIRDGPGVGFYFLAFESTKKLLSNDFTKSATLSTKIIAGCAAGIAFWTYGLPIDTVKTMMESKSYNNQINQTFQKQSSLNIFIQTAKQLYQIGGISKFYQAWPFAFGRGIPSAAITLTIYELTLEYLNNR